MKKTFLKTIAFFLLLVCGVIIFNAFHMKSRQLDIAPADPFPVSERSVQNFSKAIRFETISYDEPLPGDSGDSAFNGPFENFVQFLKTSYPLMDSLLEKIDVGKYGLLFKWEAPPLPSSSETEVPGQDSISQKPIILMAHADVVPIEKETLSQWDEAPFSGVIKDGFIYGRGTLDDKPGVTGICEAVEKLLSENFSPKKTIYIAFGFDEEIGGHRGAEKTAAYFNSKNIMAEFVLDEGLSVTEGIIPGLEKPVALIGIAEKGYVSFELTVNYPGGHSSMPEKENAITILSDAVLKIQQHPFPARISEPTELFLNTIGAEMPFFKKTVFANQWLFRQIIMGQFEKTASGNAALRTTISPTIFRSGVKENLIPAEAKAVVNFRILPGETSQSVEEYISKIVHDDRVKIRNTGIINEPSPVSGINSSGYKAIEKTIREVFPGVVVSPSLVLGATDSKHYVSISDNIYRFLPVRLKPEDLKRVHGINERIETENFKECIRFYYYLLRNCSISTPSRD